MNITIVLIQGLLEEVSDKIPSYGSVIAFTVMSCIVVGIIAFLFHKPWIGIFISVLFAVVLGTVLVSEWDIWQCAVNENGVLYIGVPVMGALVNLVISFVKTRNWLTRKLKLSP